MSCTIGVPMSPRDALIAAGRAILGEGMAAGSSGYCTIVDEFGDDNILALVPEEARRVLLGGDWRTLAQVRADLLAVGEREKARRVAEAYADAARIARELATHPAELMSRHEIADAIEARARAVAEGKGEG